MNNLFDRIDELKDLDKKATRPGWSQLSEGYYNRKYRAGRANCLLAAELRNMLPNMLVEMERHLEGHQPIPGGPLVCRKDGQRWPCQPVQIIGDILGARD